MVGAPCPLPHALHANLLVMDELGGAVLRRSDGLHQREELCLDARTGRCDHHLLGGPQRQSSALRVEGQGQRYPAQNRRRQTRARRWPCPMQLYFRYITLGDYRTRGRALSRVSVPVPKVAAKACYETVRQERVRNPGCSRCAYRVEFGRTTPGACWFILLAAKDEGLRCPPRGATCSSPDITGESGDLAWGLGVILLPPRTSSHQRPAVISLQKTARTATARRRVYR